jgi:hypothetical protein
MVVQTLVGAVVSEGVEEAESEVGMLLRYDISSLHRSTTQSRPCTKVNGSTQYLLLGCVCSRQTTLLAHGNPARSGVGAAPTQSLDFP